MVLFATNPASAPVDSRYRLLKGALLGLIAAVSVSHAQVYWDGGAGNTSWSSRNNWSNNTVPTSSTVVVLNNTYVSGAQTIALGTANRPLKTIEFTANSTSSFTLTGTMNLKLYGTSTNFTQTGAGAISISSGLSANTGAAIIMTGNGTGIVTIDGAVTDGLTSSATTGLQKNGSFTLVLNGANSQHGTVLNAGTIEFGSNTAAGGGSLTLNGGTIRAGGAARTLANAVTVGGNFTIGGSNALTLNGAVNLGGQNRTITVSNTADTTFGGAVSNGGLTKSGAGALILSANNTYGATTISQGTLEVGNGGSTGTLGTGNVTNNGALLLNRSDTGLNISSNITGTGSVTQAGTGTATLSGTNSYTGGTTVSAGKVKLASVAALGSAGAALNLAGGGAVLASDAGVNKYNTTVSANASIEVSQGTSSGTVNYSLGTLSIGSQTLSVSSTGLATGTAYSLGFDTATLSGAATLSVTNNGTGTGNLSIGTISQTGGAQSLTKTGDGTLTFTGQNSYTGTTTVSAGTVIVNANAQLADATSGLVMSGGKLTLNNAAQQLSSISGSSGIVQLGSGNTLTINESGAGSYGGSFQSSSNTATVAMNGTGSLTLSGDNSGFTGNINVLQGTLTAAGANALGGASTTTTVSANAALALSGGITTTPTNVVLAGTGVSGSGALYQSSGTNTLAGSVSLSADATIKAATGSLNIGTTSPGFTPNGHNQPTESGYVTIGGKTLTFQGAGYITVNDSIRDFTGQKSGTSYASATTLNYAPETTNPGNVVIDMAAGGTVHYLANANSYTGSTLVKNGTLIVDTVTNSNTAPHDPTTDSFHGINGAIEIGNGSVGATLKLGSGGAGLANEVLAVTSTVKLYQDGTFDVNSQSQSIGGLTFSGGGTVLLGNTGHLYLNGDVAVTANAGQTATISTTGQGVLDLTLHRKVGVDSGDVVRTFDITHGTGNTSDLTINATIQGNVATGNTASVVKSGNGVLTFGGTNTYNGVTTVANGVLNVSRATDSNGNSGLGSSAAGTVVNSGATLQLQSLSGGTVAGTISGETLTLSGGGYGGNGALQNVAGNNTWTGGITLSSANARIQSDSGSLLTISGGSVGGTAGSSLEVGGVGNTTIASSISSGVGGLTKNGSGTLILSGGNAFSGPVAVNAGTVSVQNNTALAGNTATVAAGASVTLDSTANGNLLIDSGAMNLNGTGTSGGGALQNVSGSNQYFGTVNVQSASTVTANASSTLLLGGTVSATGAQTLTVGSATNTGTVTVSGAFSNATGTASLVKAGSGTLNLNGGGTIGTVAMNGGLLSVAAATTLNTGAVTVSSGSVNVGGTVNVNGSLTVGTSTSMLIASGGRVNVTGNATFSSGSLDGSAGTLQVTGNNTLTFNGTISAPNLSLVIGGTTGAPLTVKLPSNLNVASIEITGDTILDFGNSGATLLTSGVLKITNPNAKVQVVNWVTTSNQATSDIWTVTNTINNQTLPNGTNSTGAPLPQITFQNPVGSNGSTTTWVGDTSQGWYFHEIRPTPEPATYGAMLMAGCLGLLGWRRYQRRKQHPAA